MGTSIEYVCAWFTDARKVIDMYSILNGEIERERERERESEKEREREREREKTRERLEIVFVCA